MTFFVAQTGTMHRIKRVRQMPRCNGVLEGGGVKGIGHVGAIQALEQAGYQFHRVAGSSAGAIVAALVAAGYHGDEMAELMKTLDYMKFKQTDFLDRLGAAGKALSILFHYGIYSAAYLEAWLNELLMKKHVACFRDVKAADGTYCLQVTTVDLTTQELLVMPQDLRKFHIDIDSFPIAAAVRMSMSIPIFYEPYLLKDQNGNVHYLVDGGLLSNYPINLLDDGTRPLKIPTIGFQFCKDSDCSITVKPCNTIIDYVKLIISTLLDAYDNDQIEKAKGNRDRSIRISSAITINGDKKNISTTDFDITETESEALYQNGIQAAQHFLKHWNFDKWKRKYRNS